MLPPVARTGTPVDAQSLADALARAWPSVIVGDEPTAGAIRLLLAQSAFETGAWRACWNWNLGNVKCDGSVPWFSMVASEGDESVMMVSSKWRSYDSLDEGALAYLAVLRQRFSRAWSFVVLEDPTGFVAALKASGYFTGNLAQYTAGVLAYYHSFSSITPAAGSAPAAGSGQSG